jgi:hypothetical protein
MKKRNLKLQLNKETIAKLNLKDIIGGTAPKSGEPATATDADTCRCTNPPLGATCDPSICATSSGCTNGNGGNTDGSACSTTVVPTDATQCAPTAKTCINQSGC